MNKLVTIGVTIALGLAAVVFSQTPAGPKHHTIFQVTDPAGSDWTMLTAHVTNLRNALEKDGGVEIEAVFFRDGVTRATKANPENGDILKRLADMGVHLVACQNSMRARDIKPEDLLPSVTTVDAGVAEVTRKQEAGWAYIH